MKPFIAAARQFFIQIWEDAMLAALLFVPIIMGLAFRVGVPALEAFICARLGRAFLLAPWYPIFDLLLCMMTPMMFAAAGALVVLDEADSNISRAYMASPVGKRGYLLSRIGLPSLLAIVYSWAATAIFRLSGLGLGIIALLALCSGAFGAAVALLIPSLAKNRVEGMAISKLSGLIMLGLPAALLLPAPLKYVSAFLPSFWMTELAMGGRGLNAVPALVTSALLAAIFLGRFNKRVL